MKKIAVIIWAILSFLSWLAFGGFVLFFAKSRLTLDQNYFMLLCLALIFIIAALCSSYSFDKLFWSVNIDNEVKLIAVCFIVVIAGLIFGMIFFSKPVFWQWLV